jgi:hypothetical protein
MPRLHRAKAHLLLMATADHGRASASLMAARSARATAPLACDPARNFVRMRAETGRAKTPAAKVFLFRIAQSGVLSNVTGWACSGFWATRQARLTVAYPNPLAWRPALGRPLVLRCPHRSKVPQRSSVFERSSVSSPAQFGKRGSVLAEPLKQQPSSQERSLGVNSAVSAPIRARLLLRGQLIRVGCSSTSSPGALSAGAVSPVVLELSAIAEDTARSHSSSQRVVSVNVC